ncbi:hypothetical protein Tco_0357555 [Tanacetum coccineum]
MEDDDINTIPEKESDEENESSVENLFHIPSESKVTSDNEIECDLPIFDDAPLDVFEDNCVLFSKPLFDSYGDSTSSEYSSDNESFLAKYISIFPPKIDPLLEEFARGNYARISIQFPPGMGSDFLLEETNTILSYLDYSLPELETFSFDTEEKNSGSTTTHADISLPKYDSSHFDLSDTSLHLADKSNSVFEKFDVELAHIISPPEYDCFFYLDIESHPG